MKEKRKGGNKKRSRTRWVVLLIAVLATGILWTPVGAAAQSSAQCPVYVEKLNNINSLAERTTNELGLAFTEKLAEMYRLADQSCQAHKKGNVYFEKGSPRAELEYQRALDLDEQILEKIDAVVRSFGVTAELKAKLEEAKRLYSQQVDFYAQSNQLSAQAGMAYRIGNRTVGDRLLDRANSTNDSANQLEAGAFTLLEEAAELLCQAAFEEGAPQAISPSTTPSIPSIVIQVPTASGSTEPVTGSTDAEGKFSVSLTTTTTVVGHLTECGNDSLADQEFELTRVSDGFVISVPEYVGKVISHFNRISIFGLESYDVGTVCLTPATPISKEETRVTVPALVLCEFDGFGVVLPPETCAALGGRSGEAVEPDVAILSHPAERPATGYGVYWGTSLLESSVQEYIELKAHPMVEEDETLAMAFSYRDVLDSTWGSIGVDSDGSDGWGMGWSTGELLPGIYAVQVQGLSWDGQLGEDVFYLQVTRVSEAVDEDATRFEEILRRLGVGKPVTEEDVQRAEEEVRKLEIGLAKLKSELEEERARAREAEEELRKLQDEQRRLREETLKEEDAKEKINEQLGQLQSIDEMLDRVPATYMKLVASVQSLSRVLAAGGAPDPKATGAALNAARARLDACRKIKEDLEKEKADLEKERDDLLERQRQMLREEAQRLKAAGYRYGGFICNARTGRVRIAYGVDVKVLENWYAKTAGKDPPVTKWERELWAMNARYKQVLARLKQLPGLIAQVPDCSPLEAQVKEAEQAYQLAKQAYQLAKQRQAQYQALLIAKAELCRQIRSLLAPLQKWCAENPQLLQRFCAEFRPLCAFQSLLNALLQGPCPISDQDWEGFWERFRQLVSDKKTIEAKLQVERESIDRRLDDIRWRELPGNKGEISKLRDKLEEIQRRIARLEDLKKKQERLLREQKARHSALKAKQREEKRIREILADGPQLAEPQEIIGGERQLAIGLSEILREYITEYLNSPGVSECELKCLYASRNAFGAQWGELLKTLALNVFLASIPIPSPLIGMDWGWKARVAAAVAKKAIGELAKELGTIRLAGEFEYEHPNIPLLGISGSAGFKCTLKCALVYKESTGYVIGSISCKCCDKEHMMLVRYKVNEHGRALTRPAPIIQFIY